MIQISSETALLRPLWFLFVAVGILTMLLWGVLTQNDTILGPIIDVDINQTRVNTALQAPNGSFYIQQTFIANHDGLREVELLLVRREQLDTEGTFTVTLLDQFGAVITEQTFASESFVHNQVLSVGFAPLLDSAKRPFTLQITGSPNNSITVWGYDLDVYASGELNLVPAPLSIEQPSTTARDLRLVTRYQLTGREAIRTFFSQLTQQGGLLLLALLFIPLPGVLLLSFGARWIPKMDGLAWWGTAVSLGAAMWPVLWFWLSTLGGHWTQLLLWIVFVVGWLAVIGKKVSAVSNQQSAKTNQQPSTSPSPLHPFILSPKLPQAAHLITLSLLLLGFVVRFLAIRDMAFPLWVDASRHALITAVMTETGRVISDYGAYLPVDRFPYHYGFHTISASLMMMTKRPLPDLLLYLGQFLNALVPLSVYAGAWLMTRRRDASTIAAFFVAIPFFFPAYYATWGRFTQLTGMIIMPVLIACTWLLVRGARRWRRLWWVVGLLAAGLFLVHFRVFLVYLPFALVVWLMSWGRNGRWLIAAGGVTTGLIGLRAMQLVQLQQSTLSSAVSYTISGYNQFPVGYYEAGWERYFVWAAGGVLLVLIIAVFQQKAWVPLPLALVAWVGLLFLLLIGEPLGLPETTLINLNSMYITLFVPLAIYFGVVAAQFFGGLTRLPLLLQSVLLIAVGAVGTAVFLFGIRQQLTILNPQTILAQPADLDGLDWVDVHLPQDAKIAVNSWLWLGNTYAGSDGGAWILQYTGRESTTPPADYIYSRDLFEEINAFNETAVSTQDWSSLDAANWLRDQGVTHVFVGAKGGFFDPSALANNAGLTAVYAHNGVFVFEVVP
jgi:hypothetical protein